MVIIKGGNGNPSPIKLIIHGKKHFHISRSYYSKGLGAELDSVPLHHQIGRGQGTLAQSEKCQLWYTIKKIAYINF